jgi:RNA polymerase sigma-70 factor (ECF subfamily)
MFLDRQNILRTLRERILNFAASRMERDRAEDLAQEVLIVLEEKYADLHRVEDLLPLSMQIMRFKMMGARRKMLRRGEHAQVPVEDLPIADTRQDPERMARQRMMVDRLRKALGQLGERCRELMKYKLQGKTFPEIQKLMNAASINTVYTWDLRCRKDLLERMGGDWER